MQARGMFCRGRPASEAPDWGAITGSRYSRPRVTPSELDEYESTPASA